MGQRVTISHRLRRIAIVFGWGTSLAGLTGCHDALVAGTDRQVYRLIEDRQKASLGEATDARIHEKDGRISRNERMYQFNPHPLDAAVPDAFRRSDQSPSNARGAPTGRSASREPTDSLPDNQVSNDQPADAWRSAVAELTPTIIPEGVSSEVLSLRDALAYALAHARSFQDAKEDLYLAALALTLERHLWTPQFVASVRSDYTNAGQDEQFDQALTSTAETAVTQRLPWGGEISARVIGSLLRDLTEHVTTGETGQSILSADLPLLRGAGPSAYETRYQAERELIYAVRRFEHFRRSFAVDVASDYFNLQGQKSAVTNTFVSYQSRRQDAERAAFIEQVGQSASIFEAPRAKSSQRQSEAALVSTKEQYAAALDRFKVFIGLPVDTPLEVVPQEDDEDSAAIDALLRDVSMDAAIDTALKFRLDLLNTLDQVDDRRRGVRVAENAILPDLTARGSATLDTNPDKLGTFEYDTTERSNWQAGLELRLDDRKRERNAYRESLVNLRRADRNYEASADNVRIEVRRAMRRIAQQANLRDIQERNVAENEFRVAAAREQFNLGKTNNRDVVDAENDLLAAQNQLASAVAALRIAILELRRETATLRVTDEGVIRND